MAEAAAIQPAVDAGFYRNTGSYGTPTWTEVTIIRDVSDAGQKWDWADASSRQSRSKLFGKTQMDPSGTIAARADPADAGYQAIWTASVTTTPIDVMILDGDIATEGVKGKRMHAGFNIGQDQSIGNIIYTEFEYKPMYHSDGFPKYVEMGASSTPTYTAY